MPGHARTHTNNIRRCIECIVEVACENTFRTVSPIKHWSMSPFSCRHRILFADSAVNEVLFGDDADHPLHGVCCVCSYTFVPLKYGGTNCAPFSHVPVANRKAHIEANRRYWHSRNRCWCFLFLWLFSSFHLLCSLDPKIENRIDDVDKNVVTSCTHGLAACRESLPTRPNGTLPFFFVSSWPTPTQCLLCRSTFLCVCVLCKQKCRCKSSSVIYIRKCPGIVVERKALCQRKTSRTNIE